MKENIALIGFMGTGKSTVGKILAERLRKEFIEVDGMISERAKKEIPAIFEDIGKEGFRELETEAIESLQDRKGLIISCGGGAVTVPKNMESLKNHSFIILLTAKKETIISRIGDSDGRPLLGKDPETSITKLLQERGPLYEEYADATVPTDREGPERITSVIVEMINRKSL